MGVVIIISGVILASIWFIRQGLTSNWQDAFKVYRANLGRGILLGLELLVGADKLGTVTAPLTIESVGLQCRICAVRITADIGSRPVAVRARNQPNCLFA